MAKDRGGVGNNPDHLCPTCNGTGSVTKQVQRQEGDRTGTGTVTVTCPACRGTGGGR